MPKEKSKKQKRYIIHLSLPFKMYEALKEISEFRNFYPIPDLLRSFIDKEYRAHLKERYGYYSGSGIETRKAKLSKEILTQARDAREQTLLEMSDDELTAHLRSIGYFSEDTTDELAGIIIQDRITEINNVRGYWQLRYNIQDKNYEYKRFVYNMDELIKDLKKEKRL